MRSKVNKYQEEKSDKTDISVVNLFKGFVVSFYVGIRKTPTLKL